MVIAGWIFDVSALTSVLPGWPPMKVNTALSEYAFGWELHIDQLLAPDLEAMRALGRMAFTTDAELRGASATLAKPFTKGQLRDLVQYVLAT